MAWRECTNCGPRLCRVCGEEKAARDFRERVSRRGEHGHRTECAACQSAWRKDRYRNDPDIERNRVLMSSYGISLADYAKMYESQQGLCAICGEHRPPATGNPDRNCLVIDHNHLTGQVRGLLCKPCNTGIGHLRDSPERLTAAAAYLMAFEVVSV